ncbi:Calcineurin-like phosphoesterase superfamily domain protein [Roseovarius sp. THAF27]|uniref:metallophosphoesterase family protein n=1 Tax=Roseovarius sp. THAF27 TaxID=2587850 RepID=UPI001269161B|nr:metallophosphoesterase family protein [Roseovarius sp. THAF27]QFT79467.1 Calcineurin-like phosphoesterase superfamily domain protein [Roseovarius sp. THAF27]
MKILAFSDLHLARARATEIVASSAEADLVIGAGDFCNHRAGLDEAMEMLSGIVAPIVAVPGNAESLDELTSAALPNMTVLHGTGTTQGGLSLFGLGYGVPVTPFGDWSCDLSNEEAAALLAPCKTADILVLHSPPKGVADLTSLDMSVGSTAIRDAIERIQPKLALCGHIHDSWGVTGRIGATQVVNLGPRPNWFDL